MGGDCYNRIWFYWNRSCLHSSYYNISKFLLATQRLYLTYEQYAVDCYKHIPGQMMVSATVIKNTFGVSYPRIRLAERELIKYLVWNDLLFQ